MNNVENLNAENVATELFNVATELVHDRLNEFGGGDNGAVGPDDHEPDDEKDEPVTDNEMKQRLIKQAKQSRQWILPKV